MVGRIGDRIDRYTASATMPTMVRVPSGTSPNIELRKVRASVFADQVASGKNRRDERLVDQHHRRRRVGVAIVEVAAGDGAACRRPRAILA